MPRSPATYELNQDLREYQAGWRVARRLIYEGRSWSGHERHCVFLNTADGQFGNISAVSGLDFIDDGRAVAVMDWDHDGDQDLWLRNRTGPRLRLLRNQSANAQASVAFKLVGTTCNRDAIGARVQVFLPGRKLVQTLVAGDGFISQSTKWLHFGVGDAESVEKVIVRWPDEIQETFTGIEVGNRYQLVQSSGEALESPKRTPINLPASEQKVPDPPAEARLLLATPFPLPRIEFSEIDESSAGSETIALDVQPGAQATLVNLWASWCLPCQKELADFAARGDELKRRGLQVRALSVDVATIDQGGVPKDATVVANSMAFPTGFITAESLDKLQLLMDSLFARHVPMAVPSSLLLDHEGKLAAIYGGPIDIDRLLADVESLSLPVDERRRQSVPFAGRWYSRPTGVSLDKIADSFLSDFPEDALRFYEMAVHEQNGTSPPDYAEGRARWLDRTFRLNLALGFLYRRQQRLDDALEHAIIASQVRKDDAGTWQLIGSLHRAQGNAASSLEAYQRAIELVPDHPGTLTALADLFEETGQLPAAIEYARRLQDVNPDLAVRLRLGRLQVKSGDLQQAETTLREAIAAAPDDINARANLAVILRQQRRDSEAIELLLKVVRTAPNDAAAHAQLGVLYRDQGDLSAAIRHLSHAARLQPSRWRLHFDLGDLLDADGQVREALRAYERAWELNPESPLTANNLAWTMATHSDSEIRDGRRAVELATRAVELTAGQDAGMLDTLAAAQAEAGAFDEAVNTAGQAIELASRNDNDQLMTKLKERQQLYRSRTPLRQ